MSDNHEKWQRVADKFDNEKVTDVSNEEDEDPDSLDFSALSDENSTQLVLEHPSYKELEAKLTEAQNKAHDQSMRAAAEIENIKRRTQKEVLDAHKYGLNKFINELLPVIDSLEQALQACKENDSQSVGNLREGVELTLKMVHSTLEKFSIKALHPLGEMFDPNYHEAISTQPDEKAKPNTVLQVIQKGYIAHERVIRPALVIVAKK